MKISGGTEALPHFPVRLRRLPPFDGPLLITAGTERRIGPGQWYPLEPGQVHAARFDVETSEIEFWFQA